jgi:hypothetical protein
VQVRVLHILDIKLPIVWQSLREATDDDRFAAAEDSFDPRRDFLAEIFVYWGDLFRKRTKDETMYDGDAKLPGIVILHAEAVGHSAFAINAVLKCDPSQVAARVICPGVRDAGEVLLALAVRIETNQRATVGTAVLKSVDFAIVVP